jgi:ketosteroid isomerase-like protein
MTHPNADLVRAASAAFGRGDLSALREEFFADHIIWHVAGTGPLAGDYEGVAQVIEHLGNIAALAGGTVRPQLHDVLVSDDHTVVLATIRAERAGRQLELNLVHVIHAENGKAAEIWTHSSNPGGAAQFWS